MPRTSLTKATATNFADGIADAGFEAVDQPNGNTFVNTGKTILLINNASGGNVNLTYSVGASKFTLNDAITKTPAGPVATTDIGVYGPFPQSMYGADVNIDFDTGTSITAAVVELESTPQ